MFDAVVIGGGVIGLSVAWKLQAGGMQVALIERGRVGQEASAAAGGMLCPVSETHYSERPLLELGLESMRRYPEFVAALEDRTGLQVDYDTTGTLAVALDADEARELRRLLAFQQSLGLPAEWLDADGCHEREPMLSHRAVGAVHAPQDHQIDNRKLVEALHRALTLEGCRILEQTSAVKVVSDGGRVRGVRTPGKLIQAEWVVVSGGAWSSQLGGLPTGSMPTIRPVKGQILALQMDKHDPLTRHTIRGRRAYCVPRRDGRLIVGATSEDRGYDRSLTAGGVYELLRGVYELLPGAYEVELLDMWSGFRPCSVDNLPGIGPTAVDGLIYATGHYRSGILLTPVTAWAIAQTVLQGEFPESIAPFSCERFVE